MTTTLDQILDHYLTYHNAFQTRDDMPTLTRAELDAELALDATDFRALDDHEHAYMLTCYFDSCQLDIIALFDDTHTLTSAMISADTNTYLDMLHPAL